MADLDIMDVSEGVKDQSFECEVDKIDGRKEGEEGEYLYEVHWVDGDVTFEPASKLSGAADALRIYLEANHPDDPLLKVFDIIAESDVDETENDGGERVNGVDKKLSFLAQWHQRTTRGSSHYWLRKGEDRAQTPRLLRDGLIKLDPENSPASNKDAPLVPQCVPELPSSVLFSEEDSIPGTPGSAKRIRKRYRIVEETVKMFPHEELGDLEVHQNKTLALWQEMLGVVLIVGLMGGSVCLFLYLYHNFYQAHESASS